MLLEGNSIRAVERLLRIHRDTIISLMVAAGEKCKSFLERAVQHIRVRDVQADEVWGFVFCKQKTPDRCDYGNEVGDAYCFTAIERRTKMILTWHVGKRSPEDTQIFIEKLWRATRTGFQFTTDGFRPYPASVRSVFGPRIDYATLVKIYGQPEDEDQQRRYSPPRIIESVATPQLGNPDPDRVCTSHIERSNLTLRMGIRRMTRLTNAHSKKWQNHKAALALFFAYYNFCRVHSSIRQTPAMKAGLTREPWGLKKLLHKIGREENP